MKKYLWLLFFISFSSLYSSSFFVSGVDAYSRGDWDIAILKFQDAIKNRESEEEVEISFYYLIMSFAYNKDYRRAVDLSTTFLSRYPKSAKYPDVMYQRGRLYCLLSFYEQAIKELYLFINTYPENQAVPSAYYWVAESLYLKGALQEARDVFSSVVLNYPLSRKAELAKQRILLIDQIATQQELLALLKLNQEKTETLTNELEKNKLQEKNAEGNTVSASAEVLDDVRLLDVERALEEEKIKNAELYQKLLVLEAKNKELMDALSSLYKLEEKKPGDDKNMEDSEIVEIGSDNLEKENTETKKSREALLEMLKQKAKQLKGMYNEVLEEGKNERE